MSARKAPRKGKAPRAAKASPIVVVDATADGAAVGDDGSDDDRAWARVGRLLRDLDRGRYARLYRIAEDIVAAYQDHGGLVVDIAADIAKAIGAPRRDDPATN